MTRKLELENMDKTKVNSLTNRSSKLGNLDKEVVNSEPGNIIKKINYVNQDLKVLVDKGM